MPGGNATRPGDVVRSMKGDTIEVINTDAEGRLVLADVLWYTQERFEPTGIVDLATLTGAIIIALGHEKAGVFSNDDALANAFLAAAEAEGEGAWRMPLGPAYDAALKSRIADVANVGGRPAGSITAAQFIQRFVKDGTPWVHLDIAGVAYVNKDGELGPKGRDRLGRARARPADPGPLPGLTPWRRSSSTSLTASPLEVTPARHARDSRWRAAGASSSAAAPTPALPASTRCSGPTARTPSCRTARRGRATPRTSRST